MRLLPDRPDHAGRGAAHDRRRIRPIRTSTAPWRATSAAAAPISASAPRSTRRRRSGHERHRKRQPAAASSWTACFRPARSCSRAHACPTSLLAQEAPSSARRPTRRPSTRASTSASSPTARSSSSRTDPRWAPASARRCRWSRPTSSTPTGAACTIEQGIGDTRYGDQNTDGSRSIRDFYDAFRIAGASARSMLISAAAAQWNVPAAECTAAEPRGRPRDERQRRLGYGALVPAAAKLPVPKGEDAEVQAEDARGTSSARNAPIYDLNGHRHRQGAVRPRRLPRRHGLRVDRASAGARRHGQERRRQGRARRQGRQPDGHDRPVQAAACSSSRSAASRSSPTTPGPRCRAASS